MNKNTIIAGLVVIVIAGGFFVLRSKSPSNGSDETGAGRQKSTSKNKKGKVNLLTAKEAWEKVKPEADKWSSNYKIARISDIDAPSYQRIDGASLGWKFYLEDCQEYQGGSMSDLCKEGKSRSFYYQADDIVGRKAGIGAGQEEERGTGRSTFDVNLWKIDSGEAQKLARDVVGRERNQNEEFRMEAVMIDGAPYWQVVRQCWIKGDRDNCDSQNGYSAYINLETGEAQSEKP